MVPINFIYIFMTVNVVDVITVVVYNDGDMICYEEKIFTDIGWLIGVKIENKIKRDKDEIWMDEWINGWMNGRMDG